MNPTDDRQAPGDEHRFDLLVDDELGEAERGELLSKLDDEPDGWRRCALAFLEAQAWRRAMGSWVRRPTAAPSAQPAPEASGRGLPRLHRGWTLLAMAASFLVAMFLGSRLRDLWRSPAPGGPASQEQQVAVSPPGGAQPLGPEQPEGALAQSTQLPGGPSAQWHLVDFPVDGGTNQGPQTIRLPAVQRERVDEEWLRSLPGPMSPEVLDAWQRAGYRVDQQRELLPYQMQDGRQLVVPLDRVKVHYVGRPAL